jgi:hypothetical protein
VAEPELRLARFTRGDLATVAPWFDDTRRFFGGPRWPADRLDQAEGAVGTEFRGRCLEAGGFKPTVAAPDFEGMFHYRLARGAR